MDNSKHAKKKPYEKDVYGGDEVSPAGRSPLDRCGYLIYYVDGLSPPQLPALLVYLWTCTNYGKRFWQKLSCR